MSESHNSSTNSKVNQITLRIQATIIGVLLVSMVWVVLPSTLTTMSLPPLPTAAFATVGGGVTCEGETATIVGTNGNNDITGTSGNDVIAGLGGNDRIRALGGNDIVCGGAGNDDMDGGEGRDELVGAAGNDRANGGAGNDICSAEREINCETADTTPPVLTVPEDIAVDQASSVGEVVTFQVTAEDDVDGIATLDELNSLTQDDVGGEISIDCDPPSNTTFLVGSTEVECTATDAAGNTTTETFTVTVNPVATCEGEPATIVGTSGDDDLIGTEDTDIILGLEGNDEIRGLGGDDILCGDDGNDVMEGGFGDDEMFGAAGNDNMDGDAGDDVMEGGFGIDTLLGQDGVVNNDSLDGGEDTDRCFSDPDPEINCEA
jgi:Ca2+-binding RTX toxin-like protein